MNIRSLGAAVLLSFLAVACGATKPEVTTSGATSAANVARHKSYVVEISDTPPQGYSPAKRSKVVLDMARSKVDAELAKKGYVAASTADQADMVVQLAAGVRLVVDQPTASAAAAGADAEVDEVSTLSVNILDRKTKENLFAGSAKKDVHSKTVKDADVTSAVVEMLEPIPTKN